MSVASSGNFFLITPDDDNDLELVTRAISFSAAGTLRINDDDGNAKTIPSGSLAAGIMHPIRTNKVYATGTTVTDIVGWP